MNINESPRPTVPESIPLDSARLWLAPLILGTLMLTLVYMFYLGPFWTMAPFGLIAATLVIVALGIVWYMYRWSQATRPHVCTRRTPHHRSRRRARGGVGRRHGSEARTQPAHGGCGQLLPAGQPG